MEVIWQNHDLYWHGFLTTIALCWWAGLGSLALGTLLAGFRVSPVPPLDRKSVV